MREQCSFLMWEQDFSKRDLSSEFFVSWYSHLTGRDDLQRSQGNLEVGGVGLEVEESLSDAGLKLGGVLPRRAVGSDLVKGLGAHFDGWFDYVGLTTTKLMVLRGPLGIFDSRQFQKVAKLGFYPLLFCGRSVRR